MQARQTDFKGWVLWFQWLLVNVIGRGTILVGAPIASLADLWDPLIDSDLMFLLTELVPLGIIFGLCLGTAQWLVLRKRLPRVKLWIPASVVSWTLGGVASAIVYVCWCPETRCSTLDWYNAFLASLVVGPIIGGVLSVAAQYLILRNQVHKAGWWLLTALGETIPWLAIIPEVIPEPELWLVFWLGAYAVLPGILLVWLLRHPIPQRRDFW